VTSQSPAAISANAEPVASAAGQPNRSTTSGTTSATTPPERFPPVFMSPHAAEARRPATAMAAAQ
jgi:hypothetical protein